MGLATHRTCQGQRQPSHWTGDIVKYFHLCMVVHLFASIIILTGCGKDLQTARGVVEEFIDQHYVHINLKKAKDFCVGLALHKINEEIRLTAGQVIDASTRKPKVYYRLLEEKVGKQRASFIYQGTIRVEDAAEFKRRWLIIARQENDSWRVSNFKEY